jgi:uncharacterized protein YbbC (DUF1343 family)
MTGNVLTGLARLRTDSNLSSKYKGNIGILCHSASIDSDFKHSLEIFIEIFGDKVKKVYGPQHGFVTDVQDNMIETDHFTHPHFNLPIYSLYSETRIPTDEMLEGIDHLFIDLQDVGTRIYTYIYTMTLLLEKCAGRDIEIIILDRPNPINARDVEGNILNPEYASFVGRHPMPVRHGLTMGEVALMHQKYWCEKTANVSVIEMKNYQRSFSFEETGLPYVNPSPNLPTIDGCYSFAGTVLFEGCNISEARGTTRPLEQIGHPGIDPWKYQEHFKTLFKELSLVGFTIRPVSFFPMFQKHAGTGCGGYFIQITNRDSYQPWRVSQVFLKEFKQILGEKFQYKTDGYEYESDLNPIDMINGGDELRKWYEIPGNYEFLNEYEAKEMPDYISKRSSILIYK